MSDKKIELYIVTCQSLHRALGPFMGLKDALTAAMKLNEQEGPKGCTYLPVPFDAPFKVIEAPPENPVSRSKREYTGGQYL